MLESQKLQIRQSELREKINGSLGKDDADGEELDKWTREYQTLEPKLRAALAVENKAAEETAAEPEYRDLIRRASVREYLREAATGEKVAGASAELRQERKTGDAMPWDVLLPIEDRADVATSAPTATGAVQHSIMDRVFAQTASAYLGVVMPSVPVGDSVYTHLSAGTSAGVVAAGTAHDATAATFTAFSLAPTRLTARYLIGVEALATLAGAEEALRTDLRMALGDKLDDVVLNGDGTAPNPTGFFSELAAGASAGSAVDTYSTIIGHALGGVDGKYGANLMQIKLLLGVQSYAVAGKAFTSNGETSAADYLLARSAGVRASANMPSPASNVQKGLLARAGGQGRAVAPMWESGIRLIRDELTGASKGEVAITALSLFNFKVVDEGGWSQFNVRVAT